MQTILNGKDVYKSVNMKEILMTYSIAYIIGIIDYLGMFNVCDAFMPTKVSKKFQYSIIVITAVVTNTILTLLKSTASVAEFSIMSAINTAIMCVIYSGGIQLKIFSVILYYFWLTLCENIPIIIIIYLLKVDFEYIMASVPLWILYAATSRFLTYTTTFIFQRWWRQNHSAEHTSKTEWIYMIMFYLMSIITTIVVMMYYYTSGSTEILLLVFNICVFLANIFVFRSNAKISDNRRIEQDNMLLKQQVKLSMENVESLMNTYADQRKITHDFNNHIGTIKHLVVTNQSARALEYINNLDVDKFKLSQIIKTNNAVVDAVINYKYSAANKNGIITEVKVSDLSGLPIIDEDMVALLSNIMDNAIEAASQSSSKRIKVKIENSEKELFVSIKNTVDKKVIVVDNSIVTSKSDKLNHGYGLKIVKSIVNKYNGLLNILCDDEWFAVSVLIYK